jgi:hypothetical protein
MPSGLRASEEGDEKMGDDDDDDDDDDESPSFSQHSGAIGLRDATKRVQATERAERV